MTKSKKSRSKKLRVRKVVRRRSSSSLEQVKEKLSGPTKNDLPPKEVWEGITSFLHGCRESDPEALKRGVASGGSYRFSREDGGKTGVASYRSFLQSSWKKLFKESLPLEVHLELIKIAIVYELQYRGFRRERVLHLLSEKFKKNRKDVLKLDVEALSAERQALHIAAAQCATYGEYTMAKKSTENQAKGNGARSEGKTLHLGVSACWNHLFEMNAKAPKSKRMTDAEITKFMLAEYADRGTAYFENVQPVRSKFNRGGIPGQNGVAPDTPSTRYDEDGKPIAGRVRKVKEEKQTTKKETKTTKTKVSKKRVVVKKKSS